MPTQSPTLPKTGNENAEPNLKVYAASVSADILRVCITAGGPPPVKSSLVLDQFSSLPQREAANAATTILDGFVLRRSEPGQGPLIEISTDPSGSALFTLSTVRLTPIDLVRYGTNGQPPELETVTTVDGERTLIRNLVPSPDGQAFAAELGFTLDDGEGIYGLGQDEEGGYNRRGTKVNLYQHNMRIPMPCLVSDRGYGILFDSGSLMSFDDTGADAHLRFNAVESIDFYLIAGGVDSVVRGFGRLTGRAPMLPKWAFGYLQSKERYATSDELIAVARRYRELGLPLDCVVQDWKSWPGDQWGQKTVDRGRYPDLAALRTGLHDLDVHSMVSIWPNMATGCPDHEEFAEAGLLLSDHSTYNAFDARARELYWNQLKTDLYGGFDSWWSDSTEPFSAPDWQGMTLLPDDERFAAVGGEHERYLGALRANLYSLEHARGIYEHEMAEQHSGASPVRRVLNLTRSGYPGIQRYGAVLWSGDVSASWAGLRAEISKGISMGLSGVPWWTTDAGAFFVGGTASWRRWCGDPEADPIWFWNGDYDEGVANPGYRELYTRWLQFACFLPMFRSHGTDTPREVWNFGQPGEVFYDAIVAAIQLRYRLLPYIYTLAAEASLNHGVMVRALIFDFADDPQARAVQDQFLLGDAFLVCPVTEAASYDEHGQPITPGGHGRACYLPAGTKWWDFWSEELLEGGSTMEIEVQIDRLPLFVRAGSVIPFQAPVKHALENRDVFDVVVYPGANGAGRLYDDDGLTYAYEEGDFTLVDFEWSDSGRQLTLRALSWARARPMTLRIRLAAQTREVIFDGAQTSITFD